MPIAMHESDTCRRCTVVHWCGRVIQLDWKSEAWWHRWSAQGDHLSSARCCTEGPNLVLPPSYESRSSCNLELRVFNRLMRMFSGHLYTGCGMTTSSVCDHESIIEQS